MDKRIAIVTGGIGGLGTEICRHLARSGRHVIAADLSARGERLARFRQETADLAGSIEFAPLDVSDFDACQAFAADVTARHGRIDIVVNGAGITRDTTLRKMTQAQWLDLMKVNLDGVFNVCRAVIDGMCERGFGRIVNISSVNGQTGQFGQTNYSAAKAGLVADTKLWAEELARYGIRVGAVAPGFVDTPILQGMRPEVLEGMLKSVPLRRAADPKEIFQAVRFIIECDYFTGRCIDVDGGIKI